MAKTSFLPVRKLITLLIIASVSSVFVLAPSAWFGLPHLSPVQQRVAAIFILSALLWIFECIPTWCTSLLAITLLLFTTSDNALGFLCYDNVGTLISYKEVLKCFADPVIMLFLGGFVLAGAVCSVEFDRTLTRLILTPFGHRPSMLTLGIMLVSCLFSMFMSDTATSAMMISFIIPILNAMDHDAKGKTGITLAIPIAAILGGMATPIGTPPNAIAFKSMNDDMSLDISFGEWSIRMMPYTLIMLLIAWGILMILFPCKKKYVEVKIPGKMRKDWRAIVVYTTFAVTILLWMLEQWIGVNSYVVAMIPITVFALTGILTETELKKLNWPILWMIAGGFALEYALTASGLANALMNALPFGLLSPVVVLIVAGIIAYALSNFISNSATAALLIPIICTVGKGLGDSLYTIGGDATLLVGVAMCCSLAMTLPISTPSNAIAAATGRVKTKDMAKTGLLVGGIGLVLGFVWLQLFPFS